MIVALKRRVRPGHARWRFFYGLREARRVLDLGCGGGTNVFQLHEIHPELEIHGVDLVERAEVAPRVVYRRCDLDTEKLPYADQFFDAIVFTHVIEHLRDPLRLGPEIKRVLKPGGSIYVETPNWTSMFVPSFGIKREQSYPFNFFDDPSHVKPWTKQGLFDFLSQACGLRVQKVGTVRNWLRLPFDLPAIVAGMLFGDRHLVVAAVWNVYGWCIYGTAVKDDGKKR